MIELALALPILLLITVGIIEFGRVAYYSIEVSEAARAGAQYGAQSLADATVLTNAGNIAQAAQNSAPDLGAAITLTPGPSESCACPGSASVVGGACPAAGCSYPIVYLTVNTQYTLHTLFSYPGIPASFTLNGASTMPVQRQ
jgi:Flp pilus assembly protein TadG